MNPDTEPDSVEELERSLERRRAIVGLLELLSAGGDARRVGARCLCLAHLLRARRDANQRQLAERLGLTEGRVSQLLKVLRREIGGLAR